MGYAVRWYRGGLTFVLRDEGFLFFNMDLQRSNQKEKQTDERI
jgi:hypothetical protein